MNEFTQVKNHINVKNAPENSHTVVTAKNMNDHVEIALEKLNLPCLLIIRTCTLNEPTQ